MHAVCVSTLLGRVDRYDKHRDPRARVQERWDGQAGTRVAVCEGTAEKRKIAADHTLPPRRLCAV